MWGGPVGHQHPPPSSRRRVWAAVPTAGAHTAADTQHMCTQAHTCACRFGEAHGTSHLCHSYTHRAAPHTKTWCVTHIWPSGHATHTHTHARVHTQEDETSTQPPPLTGERATASSLGFCHLTCKAVRIKRPSPQEALKTGSRAEEPLGWRGCAVCLGSPSRRLSVRAGSASLMAQPHCPLQGADVFQVRRRGDRPRGVQ